MCRLRLHSFLKLVEFNNTVQSTLHSNVSIIIMKTAHISRLILSLVVSFIFIIFTFFASPGVRCNRRSPPATVWVNPTSGTESNPGTEALPFKSLSQAMKLYSTNPDLADLIVILGSGIYQGALNNDFELSGPYHLTWMTQNITDPPLFLLQQDAALFITVDNRAAVSLIGLTIQTPSNQSISLISMDNAEMNLVSLQITSALPSDLPVIQATNRSTLYCQDSTFLTDQHDQSASFDGFILASDINVLSIDACSFHNANLQQNAAVHVSTADDVQLTNALFIGNSIGFATVSSSALHGAALSITDVNNVVISSSMFLDNQLQASPSVVEYQGGSAIFVNQVSKLSISDCRFVNNSVSITIFSAANVSLLGGAVLIVNTFDVSLEGLALSGNRLTGVSNATLLINTSQSYISADGAGIAVLSSNSFLVSGSNFSSNMIQVFSIDAGLVLSGSSLTLVNIQSSIEIAAITMLNNAVAAAVSGRGYVSSTGSALSIFSSSASVKLSSLCLMNTQTSLRSRTATLLGGVISIATGSTVAISDTSISSTSIDLNVADQLTVDGFEIYADALQTGVTRSSISQTSITQHASPQLAAGGLLSILNQLVVLQTRVTQLVLSINALHSGFESPSLFKLRSDTNATRIITIRDSLFDALTFLVRPNQVFSGAIIAADPCASYHMILVSSIFSNIKYALQFNSTDSGFLSVNGGLMALYNSHAEIKDSLFTNVSMELLDHPAPTLNVIGGLLYFRNSSIVLQDSEIGRASLGKECRSRWSPYH